MFVFLKNLVESQSSSNRMGSIPTDNQMTPTSARIAEIEIDLDVPRDM